MILCPRPLCSANRNPFKDAIHWCSPRSVENSGFRLEDVCFCSPLKQKRWFVQFDGQSIEPLRFREHENQLVSFSIHHFNFFLSSPIECCSLCPFFLEWHLLKSIWFCNKGALRERNPLISAEQFIASASDQRCFTRFIVWDSLGAKCIKIFLGVFVKKYRFIQRWVLQNIFNDKYCLGRPLELPLVLSNNQVSQFGNFYAYKQFYGWRIT